MSFQEDIEHLEAHLVDKYDIFISFASNNLNSCSEIDKVITVNTRQRSESRLYTMLHEAGHFILYEEHDYQALFPSIIHQPFKKYFTQANVVDVIRNEVLAWEEGRKLAHQLEIEVNSKKWNNLRKKSLYDYFIWAVGEEK